MDGETGRATGAIEKVQSTVRTLVAVWAAVEYVAVHSAAVGVEKGGETRF